MQACYNKGGKPLTATGFRCYLIIRLAFGLVSLHTFQNNLPNIHKDVAPYTEIGNE